MNAIFLDIDGVLNCDGTPNPRDLPYIVDQKLLRRFHRLVKASEAIVILTSSWRIDPVGLYAARYWKIPFDATCPDMPDAPRREESCPGSRSTQGSHATSSSTTKMTALTTFLSFRRPAKRDSHARSAAECYPI